MKCWLVFCFGWRDNTGGVTFVLDFGVVVFVVVIVVLRELCVGLNFLYIFAWRGE